MKRTIGALFVLAAISGCVSDYTPRSTAPWAGGGGSGGGYANVPNAQGPWGQPVAMAAPYNAAPPGAEAAASMMARSMPMDVVQAAGISSSGLPSGVVHAGGFSPASAPFQQAGFAMGGDYPPGVVAATGAITNPATDRFPTKRTEVRFVAPTGMKVSWCSAMPDGRPGFSTQSLDVPFNYNFAQAAIYRLKLSHILNRPGVELYPTIEVVPSNAKSDPFLAHSAVPIAFTDEDFEQVVAGNYVVKVVYLPEPQFQDLVVTGPDEIVSSRLEPGVNPIVEASKRGSILLIARLGNINLEAPNTPPMDAPSPYAQRNQGGMPPNMQMPGGMPMMPQGMGNGMPGMQGGPMMPPGMGNGMPGMQGAPMMPPQAQQGAAPISKLPDPAAIQQTQYRAAAINAAQMATQADPNSSTTTDKKSSTTSSGWQPFWSSTGK
jgi:hypothetical protein